MNAKIYELAEQAGAYCESLRGGDYKPPVLDGMDLEKFAELIVRECAGVVEKNLFESIGWNTCKKVKQHFGVEE